MNNKYSLPKDGGLIEVSAPRDIIHRYEKIHTTVYENEYLGVQYVADTIVKAIRTYNEIHCSNEVYEESQPFVLGLTTGRTPLGLYRELVKRHEEGIVSFRNVAVFSLDEFYPIRSTEQQSRNFRIHEDFLNHIDILPENIHIPDGTVPEARISEYCASYDHSVRKIDLMIIGVGEDGPEGVVPFNKRGAAPLAEGIAEQLEKLGGGNGGDTHVTINVYATVREEADIRKLSREIAKEIRRTQLREGAYA